MTDKVQKIREEVERLRNINVVSEYKEYAQYELDVKCGYEEALDDIESFINSLPEEPVSEKKCMFTKDSYTDEDRKVLCDGCEEECKYAQKEEPVSEGLEKELSAYVNSKEYTNSIGTSGLLLIARHFAEWQKSNLWKPADDDDLPEYEREVVVFTQNFPDDAGIMSVAIGHRPNPDGWDGKSITTGNIEHHTPKTYGKGGWNIPDVKYWLDCSMPKEIEL